MTDNKKDKILTINPNADGYQLSQHANAMFSKSIECNFSSDGQGHDLQEYKAIIVEPALVCKHDPEHFNSIVKNAGGAEVVIYSTLERETLKKFGLNVDGLYHFLKPYSPEDIFQFLGYQKEL